MAQDPVLAPGFGMKQRHEMLTDIAKLKGFSRFSAYLDPNAPPPPPDPFKTRELDIKEKTANAAMMSVQVKQNADNRLFAMDQSKLEQNAAQMKLDAMTFDKGPRVLTVRFTQKIAPPKP